MAAGKGRPPRHPEVRSLVDSIDNDRLARAIAQAEERTTGQIRVHLAYHAAGNVEKLAREKFRQLKMAATTDRNAVLIFLAPKSRKLFVTGDVGIDKHLTGEFWKELAERLATAIGEGRSTEGLEAAVADVGEVLARHFPASGAAPGGLSDDVTED